MSQTQARLDWIESALHDLEWLKEDSDLTKAVRYSLWQKGKRFRPTLAILLAEEFGVSPRQVMPVAIAVEMIHTYSLIHDDLPCMDDDDIRRGEPTNHKVYGEALALLAGDALQAEAFRVVALGYQDRPEIGLKVISLLGEAAGALGMVGGQALDMSFERHPDLAQNVDGLLQMHALKTGALIRVACEGAAVAMGLPARTQQLCRELGASIGLAFQLKDDLLDSSENQLEPGSLPAAIGLAATEQRLKQTTEHANELLRQLGRPEGPLHNLVRYNYDRQI